MQERIDYKKLNFQLAKEILGGKNVVFTGRGFLVRGELMRLARQAGANVDSIVTKKCDILIVGEKPGSKLRKAKVLGCDIITISDFRDILEGKIKKDKIEIDDILKKRNYCLPSHLYFKIVENSSQICQVKYDAYSDKYSIHTDDGYHWEVKIYQE